MRFTFAELPGIFVYPDDASPESFYAVPAKPRVAYRDDGRPDISLLIRKKKVNNQSEVTGGFLTVTASLGLSGNEEATLIGLLTRKLVEEAPPDPDRPAPKPRLLGIRWLSGEVQLGLDQITAEGMPAMFGDNRCAFSIPLSAEQAKAVSKAWREGPLNLRVHYQMKAQSAPAASSRTESASTQTAILTGSAYEVFAAASHESSVTTSVPCELDVEGPLDLAKADLLSSLTEVSL
jgi:hypothetical protein